MEGALADHVGRFEKMGDKDRAIPLLDLLGRKVHVQTSANILAAVGYAVEDRSPCQSILGALSHGVR